jgi:hypothetical protein
MTAAAGTHRTTAAGTRYRRCGYLRPPQRVLPICMGYLWAIYGRGVYSPAVDKCPAHARGERPQTRCSTLHLGISSPPTGDELIPLVAASSSRASAALASLHPCRRGAGLGRKQGRYRLLVDAPRTHQNALRCGFCVWAGALARHAQKRLYGLLTGSGSVRA